MKPSNHITLMIAVAILLISFQSHAKTTKQKDITNKASSKSATNSLSSNDIGVCVQIIEHSESDLITKKQNKNDNKKTTSPAPPKKIDIVKELGSTPIQIGSTESPSNETNPKESLETAHPHSPDNKPASADPSGPRPPTPPTAPTPQNEAEKQLLDKELAAERSNLEMVKKNNFFDTEIDNLPYGQTALVYLKRLFEHFVTHESGYASVSENCNQTITVELYPLKRGWTAFARYSGTNREERVDQLYATELSQFAERSVLALLNDVPISTTIKRDNVLSSDSKRKVQQVKGSNHFTINIGTKLVGAIVDQVQTDGDNAGGVAEEFQLFHPMKFGLGYRGRFENWGLEVQTGLGIGVGKKAASSNPQGGHIDYGGDAGLAIHFLHYKDPRGLVSFYLGGGAGFDFMWLSAVNAQGSDRTRSYLYAGGLSGDGVFGWEFLRAASVQFFIQGEVNLPLYISRSENRAGSISSWMPGVSFKLGVVF